MIHRSPYPDIAIPDVSLPDLVLERTYERGDKPALVDAATGHTLTYRHLTLATIGLANALRDVGFGHGDVAAICAPNHVDFAIAFLAVAIRGGATTTLNPALTPDEMRRQLTDAGARILFTVPELASKLSAAGAFEHVLILGSLPAAPIGEPPDPIDPARDVAALPYSSGTTGTAKGVMLTHRNLVATLHQLHPQEATSEQDVVLATLPFFHIYGLVIVLLLGLYRGATLVVLPRFDMAAALDAIERWRVTRLPIVPPIVHRLLNDPQVAGRDLSSLNVVISGAAPLAPESAIELARRLRVLVKQGYGMTELSPISHMQAEEPGQAPTDAVGVLHPNTECRLVDPATGQDAPEGEIWVRGPQMMRGYLGRPEATAEIITPEGWLRTGDIGRVGEDGQLRVVDRLKELIKFRGYQVAPAELEAILIAHPAVADAAVVPRPDPEAGEIPVAYVALNRPATPEELIAHVAAQVAPHKRVRAVEVVAEVPRSPSGKVLRRLLVERQRSLT